MRKFIVIISSFFFLPWNNANGQISNDLQNILNLAFQSPSLSNLIFDKSFIKNGAVYVYMNREFTYHASNAYKDSIDLPGWASGMAHLFDIQEHKVYGFGRVIEFGAYTANEVDTVVVIDKLSYDKTTAVFRFHTTNLNSRWFQKKANISQDFRRVKIMFLKKGSAWIIEDVSIIKTPFRSILDKER